jgi:hypothetical protein
MSTTRRRSDSGRVVSAPRTLRQSGACATHESIRGAVRRHLDHKDLAPPMPVNSDGRYAWGRHHDDHW